jgi:hypothetical protein
VITLRAEPSQACSTAFGDRLADREDDRLRLLALDADGGEPGAKAAPSTGKVGHAAVECVHELPAVAPRHPRGDQCDVVVEASRARAHRREQGIAEVENR